MKQKFASGVFLTLVLAGVVFLIRTNFASAQKISTGDENGAAIQDNKGVDEGFNNEEEDIHGCVWNKDVLPNGAVNYHTEEPQAPPEFYIESPPLGDPCNFYEQNDWKNLKDKGEEALWPIGCFNPVNLYVTPLTGSLPAWIGAYGAFEFNKNYDSWDEMYYATMGAFNKRQNPPNVDLKVASMDPAVGSQMNLTAGPLRYNSPLNKILYGWSTQLPGESYVSQEGLVAGGRELTQADVNDIRVGGKEVNFGACKRVTRKVVTDSDKDGLDDNWEKRYAPNGDISKITRDGDDDKDGIVLAQVLAQENKPPLDPEGNPIDEPDVYSGIRVTPDTTASSAPGDGTFTNQEEFIWGTNPEDPDTDDDGFPDEADILGLGQMNFKATSHIDQREGVDDRMNYRVATVGISNFASEDNSGHKKVFIDSEAKTVYAGIQNSLDASLLNINEQPNANNVTGISQLNNGSDIYVEASAFQSEGDKAALDYAWFVQLKDPSNQELSEKVHVPSTPDFTKEDIQQESGRIGKYIFRHKLTELEQYMKDNLSAPYTFDGAPGSLIYITVEMCNLVTHEFASKRIPIAIGSDKTMAIQITDLNTSETMSIEDYTAKYCSQDVAKNQLPNPAFCAYQGRSLNEILPWIVFEGSRIVVTAEPIQADAKNVTLEWWVNGEKVNEAYGPDSQDNQLTIYPESTTQVYTIQAKAYTNDKYRNEIYNGQVSMQVMGPEVAVLNTPLTPTVGSSLQLSGQLLNFPETNVGSYSWTITSPNGTEQKLTGKNPTLNVSDAGNYHVKLEVAFQGAENTQRVLVTEKDITVGTATLTPTAQIRKTLASMASIVQAQSIRVYEFAFVGFIVLIGVLYFFGFIKKRSAA